MAKKDIPKCPTCGARMSTNDYVFNITLVRALSKLAKYPGQKARGIMDKSEYSVYTKLKFWEMITREEDGLWYISGKGLAFLMGDIPAAKKITYFRDKIVQTEGMIYVDQIFKTEESKQKYRDWVGKMDLDQAQAIVGD